MSDEIGAKSETTEDGDKVAKNEKTETKEPKRSVSFNRDVHVKRFGKPRESRGTSVEQKPPIRKEPFTHLSEQELIEEANKVRAQAESVTCTTDDPEKFFSLPHRKKLKEDRSERRNSDDAGSPEAKNKALGRSTSDVTNKRRKERTSLSTLFRKSQKTKPDVPIVVATKPVTVVKRSKSDVSDLKSNTQLNTQPKPIRKRSGSESEEFLKSLRNKKNQLSPIIESSPREDYFKKTSPLDLLIKQKLANNENLKKVEKNVGTDIKKVNPVVKPPRYKTPETQDPKPPARTKRGKSSDKELSPSITETPKRKTEPKKALLVDEIDSFKAKEKPADVKERIKDSIRKLEENIYGKKEMIHSSQQPPDKPPLTRGHTVDHIVKILKEDQQSPPPKSHLITPVGGTNINQPFSYTKPTVSPDPNLFIRTTSPERVPSPVNKMADKGIVYAHVVRDNRDKKTNNFTKQTIHKTYSPVGKNGNISDEDEGLGYEDRYKFSPNRSYEYDHKPKEDDKYNSIGANTIIDSPIKPRYREYRLTNFQSFEPTYANEYIPKEEKPLEYIDTVYRGRADGMDTKRNVEPENNVDLDFNELSHRRQLLESRLNARKQDRIINTGEPISRYLAETDPIYEAEKRMKATEKYVNETARYYRHTVERDGLAESSVTEEFNKYDSDNQKIKYNTTNRTFDKGPRHELDRRDFLNDLDRSRFAVERKEFPPEPEYEPPSLELEKPVLTANEYKEKKYKVKKHFTSSQDALQSGHKYKGKDDWFGKRKGHYASNPEIAKEREDDYANIRNDSKQAQTYHNSLRRMRNKDRYCEEDDAIRRHDSGNSHDYYHDRSPRRYEIDNRLVDSGIENDFRKSSGEFHRSRYGRHESDDDVRNTSLFIDHEKRHTEDNYPSEQIYANGEYLARFEDFKHDKKSHRDHSSDDRSHYDPKADRYDRSPSRIDEKISAKPPKAAKKLSGLEKMKQLFSRDSSKKSKKEKEVQPKPRTRVLKSPEHLARDDCEYRRYTDPEPSDIEVTRRDSKEDDRKVRSSREDLDRPRDQDRIRGSREELGFRPSPKDQERTKGSREKLNHRHSPRDSDQEKKYRETDFDEKFERTLKEERRYAEHREEKRRHNSSDRESDLRPSDVEDRRHRSRTAGPMDSPALAERYRERRRLATPSPTPSPPRRPAPTSAGNWFKSLDRLTQKKKTKTPTKVEKETSPVKPGKLNSPAKNLRFFGDTDQESDSNMRHSTVTKSKSHPTTKPHNTLRKTNSNSSTGVDEVDHVANKSYSLTNLRNDNESPRNKSYYKRNLHNISEIHSNSETESNLGRKSNLKPPMSPYERRSRSHSSSKTLKGSKGDLRRNGKDDRSSSADRRRNRHDDRGSSSELRSSRQELSSKSRRRPPATHSGESSTEDSSHPSQRSIVYLHATTVGDIPDPGRLSRNRSRDDVSSVNSSAIHVKSTTKSFSMFAPWSPRHTTPRRDLHYAQKLKTENKPEPGPLQKNKSYSQTTLSRRPQNNRLTSSSTTLHRKQAKQDATLTRNTRENARSQSNEVLSRDREKVSRSISMPKDDNKKAGWFKLTNKNKKDVNTRVR